MPKATKLRDTIRFVAPIYLGNAVLCLDCDTIYDSTKVNRCPKCFGESSERLTHWLPVVTDTPTLIERRDSECLLDVRVANLRRGVYATIFPRKDFTCPQDPRS